MPKIQPGELCANIALTEGNEGGLYIGCYRCIEPHPLVELGIAWEVRHLPCCQNGWDRDDDPSCETGDDEEQRRVTLLLRAAQRAREAGRPVDAVLYNEVFFGYDFYERP